MFASARKKFFFRLGETVIVEFADDLADLGFVDATVRLGRVDHGADDGLRLGLQFLLVHRRFLVEQGLGYLGLLAGPLQGGKGQRGQQRQPAAADSAPGGAAAAAEDGPGQGAEPACGRAVGGQ